MLLGCNYSEELLELLKEGKVKVDYIKMGLFKELEDKFDEVRQISPILIHGLGLDEDTSKELSKRINYQDLNKKLKYFGCPHLGVHFAGVRGAFNDSICREEYIEISIAECKSWKENLSIPFLIENTLWSWYYDKKGIISYSIEPELISKLCEEADIGMILDIAHAKVSAWSRNESVYSYLEKLPLHRVKEVHVVGNLYCEETGLRDKHVEMESEDYEILRWIINRTSPSIVTLEYSRPDKEALLRQLTKITEIIST